MGTCQILEGEHGVPEDPESGWKWHVARAEEALEAAARSGLPTERIQAHTARARGHLEVAREMRSAWTWRRFEGQVMAGETAPGK